MIAQFVFCSEFLPLKLLLRRSHTNVRRSRRACPLLLRVFPALLTMRVFRMNDRRPVAAFGFGQLFAEGGDFLEVTIPDCEILCKLVTKRAIF
jgi:hypothetical protein